MPESIFNLTPAADGSIFAPEPGFGADTWLSFSRSSLRLSPGLSQPLLNSAGETSLSFVSIARYLVSLQPLGTNYARFIHGTIVEVHARVFILGPSDVREGDRCVIGGRRMEVVDTSPWGDEHNEIDLRYLGR
jgi:hypothetical protein